MLSIFTAIIEICLLLPIFLLAVGLVSVFIRFIFSALNAVFSFLIFVILLIILIGIFL